MSFRRTQDLCRGLGAFLLVFLGAPATSEGQSTTIVEDDRMFFESLDVEIVGIDVVVTDAAGRPVEGLGRDDFEVFEDGRPVELSHFAAVSQPPGETDETVVLDSGARDVQGGAPSGPTALGRTDGSGLRLVVFVNQLDLTPQGRNRLLRELSEEVRSVLRPGDLAMVIVFDGRARILQELTGEEARISAALVEAMGSASLGGQSAAAFRDILQRLAAVDLNEEALRSIGGDNDGLVFRARSLLAEIRAYAEQQVASTRRSMDGLRDVLGWLGGIPGRKALLYVGDGLPLQPAGPLFEAWRSRFEFTDAGGIDDLRNEGADRTRSDLSDQIGPLADFAAAQRVAVYALASDARGSLLGSAAGGRGSAGPPMRGAALRWDPGGQDASTPRLASETSGAFFRGDADGLLQRLRTDFDSYYELAYTPDRSRDGDLHQVEVRLADAVERQRSRDYELRYRRQYRAADPLQRLENLTRSALVLGELANPLEVAVDLGVTEVPAEAATGGGEKVGDVATRAPTKADEKTTLAPVLVRIRMKNVTLLPRGDHHEGRLQVFVAARDEQGRMSDVMQTTVPVRIPNRQLLTTLNQVGGYRMDLRLRPRRHTVAVVVYDQTARTTSAVRTEFSPTASAALDR